MRYIFIVLLLLLNTSYANSEPIKFKHPDNLFEFFYLDNWSISSYSKSKSLFKRNSSDEFATLSINVTIFSGDKDSFLMSIKKHPNIILDSIKRKFPDAKIDETKSSYLGSYPGHYLKLSYTIKNFDTKFNCVSICLLSIKDNKLYTVLFETQKDFFYKIINEFRCMIASFCFTS